MAIPISRYYNLLNAFSNFDTENDSIEILKKIYESEEKSMLHSVTVKHEENKVLESCYVMCGTSDTGIRKVEKELDNEPTPYEIAQFLSDSGADFVSVVQNYRFASEFPF